MPPETTYSTASAAEMDATLKRAKRSKRQRSRFKLIPVRDIHYDPMDDHWLIDGLLPMTGLATIWGKYKSYKSFIGFDVAVALADQRQKAWAERALAHGSVVYVVAEDMNGFDVRVEAYRRERAGFDELPLYIIKGRPNLGTNPSDREELIEAITNELGDVQPVAIFLDTLARMVGSEGENEKGMQNFVNNAEHVAEVFGCLCIAIHHESAATDADRAADKPRGHTSLPGAIVASWHVIKTADGIEGPWTADIIVIGAKNSATGFALQAEMERIDLGVNRHGRMETILMLDTVEWATDVAVAAKAKVQRPSASLSLLLDCFEYAKSAKGGKERRQVRGHDGPWADVVEDGKVREVFFQRYAKPTKLVDEDDAKARRREIDRKTKAYDRSIVKAVEIQRLFTEASADGRVFLWTA
ncbi:AAA domain-containing protein [Rhodospirillales bacterium URHD0017]|nr:AAA domain-containing protein [Rhodospirillales bacterium URHD0017]